MNIRFFTFISTPYIFKTAGPFLSNKLKHSILASLIFRTNKNNIQNRFISPWFICSEATPQTGTYTETRQTYNKHPIVLNRGLKIT